VDITAHRQQMLKHCLWLASLDPAYAIWASQRYEQQLRGL